MTLHLNMNDTIFVRLTKFGEDYLNEHYKKLSSISTANTHRCTTGECVFQLWELMNIFGPVLYNGATELPFKPNEVVIPLGSRVR